VSTINQAANQVVDITSWSADEVYPEGAREKSLLFCPSKVPQDFLKSDHPYLFKYSSHNYPEQFWIEIIAYRLGQLMNVPVPPAFVGYNRSEDRCGALIEWFLRYPDKPTKIGPVRKFLLSGLESTFLRHLVASPLSDERYVPGGDVMQRIISSFDRKRGTQHNWLDTNAFCKALEKPKLLNENWHKYWAKAFVFDALIGNTDRHQDNWGTMWSWGGKGGVKVRFTPVFDNGTSMGHEIMASKFFAYDDKKKLELYVERGAHHMKWQRNDSERMNHGKFLLKFCLEYPESKQWMQECLNFEPKKMEELVMELTSFDVPVRLSIERARFIVKLLHHRYDHLTFILGSV